MHIKSLSNITEYCIAFYFSVNINFKFQVAFSISFRGILCTPKLTINAMNFSEIVFATSSAVYIIKCHLSISILPINADIPVWDMNGQNERVRGKKMSTNTTF